MSENALTFSQISNVMRGLRLTRELRNVAGTRWAANFDDPGGHHLSIFGPERK
jgi:hypothetical protein